MNEINILPPNGRAALTFEHMLQACFLAGAGRTMNEIAAELRLNSHQAKCLHGVLVALGIKLYDKAAGKRRIEAWISGPRYHGFAAAARRHRWDVEALAAHVLSIVDKDDLYSRFVGRTVE